MLVVGGTSGIGAAVAAGFAAESAVVTVTGATEAEAEAAVTQGSGEARVLDFRDGAAVGRLIACQESS